MKTYSPKSADVDRTWYVVDVRGMVLGRAASEVAKLLRGKHKPQYAPHMDMGDHIIVLNAARVEVSGQKRNSKTYSSHSGYPGGLSERSLGDRLQSEPDRVFRDAVKGMLPKGPLGRSTIRKLKVYPGDAHPHTAQRPAPIDFPTARRDRQRSRVHHQEGRVRNALEDVGLRMFTWEPETDAMSVLRVEHGELRGGRVETGAGLLNVLSDKTTVTISWSTSHGPETCFEFVVADMKLLDAADDVEFAFGVLSRGKWNIVRRHRREAHPANYVSKLLNSGMGSVEIARLEVPGRAWVWQSRSPLQSGEDVATFGLVANSLDSEAVLDAFVTTANTDVQGLRKALTQALAADIDIGFLFNAK